MINSLIVQKRTNILYTFSILGIALVLLSMLVACFFPFSPNVPQREDMEMFFINNRDEIIKVRDFLLSSEFDRVSIRAPISREAQNGSITMFTGHEYGHIPIEDEDVLVALKHLFQYVPTIVTSENGIIFLTWRTRDHGRGIVYFKEGITPDEWILPFLTEIEPLTEEGWYFYVENFDEWRLRNRNR